MSESSAKLKLMPYVVDMTQKIGHGAFGVVYKGNHSKKNFDVAAKQCDLKSDKAGSVAMHEIKHFQYLKRHPHIVKLLDFHYMNKSFWMIMEFCDAGDLDNYFKEKKPLKPFLNEQLDIMYQCASAIAYMHGQRNIVVHRDIKPGNLLMMKHRKSAIVKVTDFGLSKIVEASDPVKTLIFTTQAGTPGFMAPELFLGLNYEKAVDVFSLGMVFLAMISFKPGDSCLAPVTGEVVLPIGGLMAHYAKLKMPFPEYVMYNEGESCKLKGVKDLIKRMTQYCPKQRCCMAEVEGTLAILGGKSPLVLPEIRGKETFPEPPDVRSLQRGAKIGSRQTVDVSPNSGADYSGGVKTNDDDQDKSEDVDVGKTLMVLPELREQEEVFPEPPDAGDAKRRAKIENRQSVNASPNSDDDDSGNVKIKDDEQDRNEDDGDVGKSPLVLQELREAEISPERPDAGSVKTGTKTENRHTENPNPNSDDGDNGNVKIKDDKQDSSEGDDDTDLGAVGGGSITETRHTVTAASNSDDDENGNNNNKDDEEDESDDDVGFRVMKRALEQAMKDRLDLSDQDLEVMRDLPFKEMLAQCIGHDKAGEKFEVGEQVKILDDKERVSELQDGYGGWNDEMTKYLGRLGIVTEKPRHVIKVLQDDGVSLHYNPKVLIKTGEKPYQPSELRNLTTDDALVEAVKGRFKRFDIVTIPKEEELVKCLQENHGGWNPKMKQVLGVKEMVNRVDRDGDVFVEFINGEDWFLNPELLVQVDMSDNVIESGDFVIIKDERSLVRKLQKQLGMWIDKMEEIIGHSGVVRSVSERTISVKSGRKTFSWHPSAIKLVAKGEEMMEAILKKNLML